MGRTAMADKKKKFAESAKANAFDTILANVNNQKLSDADFRNFIRNTWANNPEDQ